MKNAFNFTSTALFVLKIFLNLFWNFGDGEKQFDKKVTVNFKIYDIKNWTINNYNIHIARYLKKNQTM